jgi:signal transduction histidine kinase
MRYLLILMVALLPLLAGAVEFDESTRTLGLGHHSVQVLEDPSGEATVRDISSPAMASGFHSLDGDALSQGYSRSAFWLKIDLLYRPQDPVVHRDWLLELAYPPMDRIDLYLPDAAGRHQLAVSTGDMLPFSSRQIKQNNYLFDLDLPPGQGKTLYLRVSSNGSIQAPLKLWAAGAYLEEQPARLYVLGALYGVLLVMLVYNLCIYVGVRERSYLYYILYIASFGFYLLAINGTGIEFLWPDNPWWANTAPIFLMATAILFACQFTRSFLHTRDVGAWLDRSLMLLMGAAGIVMLMSLNPDYALALRLSNTLVLVFTVTIFVACIAAICKGVRVARYFLIAWSALLLGSAIHVAMLMGYLAHSFFTMYANQIGSVLEVALLSMALASRINQTREEQALILLTAGQNLERVNQELAASNRCKDEFLATLTHELRTPMNGVIGSLELMHTVPMNSELAAYQRTAASSAQDMMSMVNGILTLTELQAGRITVAADPFELRRLFHQLRARFAGPARAKGLNFILELDQALPGMVQGDASKLRQCLDCLLDNAIKFTKSGSVKVRVSGQRQTNEKIQLLIEVMDSGIGFSRLDEATLYQNFFQIDGSMTREHGGLGIGLAICRQLIELQGGQLHHRSEPGRGSCFELSVPLLILSDVDADLPPLQTRWGS